MKDELKYLTQKECEIITKLRTEYINLNHYLFSIGQIETYKCKYCKHPETVDHYLLHCPGCTKPVDQTLHKNNVRYDGHRNVLKKELRKITSFFRQAINFTSENMLFPHIWQRKLTGKNNNDKWNRDGIYYRAQILKSVAKFVFNTRRFNTEYGF